MALVKYSGTHTDSGTHFELAVVHVLTHSNEIKLLFRHMYFSRHVSMQSDTIYHGIKNHRQAVFAKTVRFRESGDDPLLQNKGILEDSRTDSYFLNQSLCALGFK